MVHKCQAVNAWCFCFVFFLIIWRMDITTGYPWVNFDLVRRAKSEVLARGFPIIPCLQTLTGKSGGYKLAFMRVQAADNLEVTMGKLYTSLGTGNWEGSTAGQWFPFTNPPTSASIYLIKLSPSRTAYRPPKGRKKEDKLGTPENFRKIPMFKYVCIRNLTRNKRHFDKSLSQMVMSRCLYSQTPRFKSFEWYTSTYRCARSRIGNTGRKAWNTVGTRQFPRCLRGGFWEIVCLRMSWFELRKKLFEIGESMSCYESCPVENRTPPKTNIRFENSHVQ